MEKNYRVYKSVFSLSGTMNAIKCKPSDRYVAYYMRKSKSKVDILPSMEHITVKHHSNEKQLYKSSFE